MKAFYHDNDSTTDYREEHNTGREVTPFDLLKLGVLYHKIETLDEVNALAKARDYKHRDQVEISPTSFSTMEELKTKLDTFYSEHIHEDEEIRYILDGEGYFDVRSAQDEWIRIKVSKYDLIIVPAGIYHRFTLSTKNYIKAMRLFQDEPKWVPLNRPVEDNEYRQAYLKSIKA